jgi:uncharacterized protein
MNIDKRLRLTPGGALGPDQVIGRSDLVSELIRTLQVQSVVLVAERRTGKTSVLTLLEATPNVGRHIIKLSVEGVQSPAEFVRRLADAAKPYVKKNWEKSVTETLDRFGITTVGPISRETGLEPQWKVPLEKTLEALANCEPPVVVVLDELPYAIQNIGQHSGHDEARAVLDTLRNARQDHRDLRFVFCGSIGFHHLLQEFRDGSWNPINDMLAVSVEPLSVEWATFLARSLLVNERVTCTDIESVAEMIVRQSEGVPFYIHQLISRCKSTGSAIAPESIAEVFDAALDDAADPLGIRHLEVRLGDYYGQQADIAKTVLDIVANAGEDGLAFAELERLMRSQRDDVPNALLRSLLDDLKRDHYLVSIRDLFRFRLNLLRTVWRRIRYIG